MHKIAFLFICLLSFSARSQTTLQQPFTDEKVKGSITLFDYKHQNWIMSDSIDASLPTVPASTFKIINLLIALETGVISSELDTVRWVGKTDTTIYGYRLSIYKDMTVKEAFEVSAGWVFVELSKKIGGIFRIWNAAITAIKMYPPTPISGTSECCTFRRGSRLNF